MGISRPVGAPQVVDQPIRRHDLAAVDQEVGQQRPHLDAGIVHRGAVVRPMPQAGPGRRTASRQATQGRNPVTHIDGNPRQRRTRWPGDPGRFRPRSLTAWVEPNTSAAENRKRGSRPSGSTHPITSEATMSALPTRLGSVDPSPPSRSPWLFVGADHRGRSRRLGPAGHSALGPAPTRSVLVLVPGCRDDLRDRRASAEARAAAAARAAGDVARVHRRRTWLPTVRARTARRPRRCPGRRHRLAGVPPARCPPRSRSARGPTPCSRMDAGRLWVPAPTSSPPTHHCRDQRGAPPPRGGAVGMGGGRRSRVPPRGGRLPPALTGVVDPMQRRSGWF